MKTYTLEIKLTEGNDEFWESFKGRTGCDDVLDLIKQTLADFDPIEIKLTEFKDNS